MEIFSQQKEALVLKVPKNLTHTFWTLYMGLLAPAQENVISGPGPQLAASVSSSPIITCHYEALLIKYSVNIEFATFRTLSNCSSKYSRQSIFTWCLLHPPSYLNFGSNSGNSTLRMPKSHFTRSWELEKGLAGLVDMSKTMYKG